MHRDTRDRLVGVFRNVRRYRCRAQGCAWQGLLERPGRATVSWVSAIVALIVIAAAAIPLFAWYAPAEWIDELTQPVQRDTDASPTAMLPVAPAAPIVNETVATDASRRGPPLGEPRRDCVWRGSGQNPYVGTLVDGLSAARLPSEIVGKFVMMRDANLVSDRLEISSHGIRTSDGRRNFGDTTKAMTLDGTICFETRIDVPSGTIAGADLYELTAGDGQRHAIMIVRSGGNVALLGASSDR